MLTTGTTLRLISLIALTLGLVYQTGGWRALRRGLHNTIEEGLPLDPDRPPWARPAIWLGLFLLLFSFAWDIAEHFR